MEPPHCPGGEGKWEAEWEGVQSDGGGGGRGPTEQVGFFRTWLLLVGTCRAGKPGVPSVGGGHSLNSVQRPESRDWVLWGEGYSEQRETSQIQMLTDSAMCLL